MSKTFQYTILTADYNSLDEPIINLDGSFTTLNKTTAIDQLNTIVSYEYVFVDNGTTNDGLYLYNAITTSTNMIINTFDDIPLSRTGSNFREYDGEFPTLSTDIPVFLSGGSMNSMFQNATNFNQDINSWDVSSVTILYLVFYQSAFNQDLNSWDVSSVTSMQSMFQNATNFNQDINSWDVSSVTNMDYAFQNAYSFNGNISNWDVSSVGNMNSLLGNTNFNQDISSWNVSAVTDMHALFKNTPFNQNISNWDVSLVADMSVMFSDATAFNQNLSLWNLNSITTMDQMLNNSGVSVTNYSDILIGWNNNVNTPNSIILGASNLIYNSLGEIAKDNLTNVKTWTITDSGLACMHETIDVLCLINNEQEYINIKNIKKGDNVVTYKDGIVKVKSIHKCQTFNSKKKKASNFFILPKDKCSILTHDLIITGGHSIIVDTLTKNELNFMENIYKNNYYKLHDKYKLLPIIHKDFICKNDESVEDVYMLLLENTDSQYSYGVYANGGYLIETCGEQSFINFNYSI